MIQRLLNFTETPDFLDATDGLAVAVCHAFQRNIAGKSSSGSKKSYSGWDTFAKDNAARVSGVVKKK
ncbi:MAG: crossover junction endodeoxyribonuclease RuvC, partial [Chitinophagaceae bacterium]